MANIQIKRKTAASTYENLYPATVISQVDGLQAALDLKINTSARGVANGVASLDASGLVPASQLSSYIQGGVRIKGTMSQAANDTVGELITILETIVTNSNGAVSREELIGYAFIGSADFELTQGTLPANTAFTINPGDEGDATVPINLEAGDILLVSNYSFSSPTHTYTFAVINNTYGAATSSAPGIVTVVGASQNAGRYNASTNALGLQDGHTDVVTENFLYDNITVDGTDLYNAGTPITNKIAPASHTHSQYQPLDATLTNFAGLTIAADTLVYGNGNDTFTTMSLTSAGRAILDDADTTAQRATLGLVIGTNVQAYSAKLADIAGLAVTDSNFIVGNGTNFVAESGSTARTSLDVYSTSEVDTLVSTSVTNKPNIYYDLAKTTADSSAPVGSYIYDDLSTSNGW